MSRMQLISKLLVPTAMLLVLSDQAIAGTSGTEFDDIWTTITDWSQGTLGKVIAGGMIVIGLVAGMARQNLMAFATGIGGGMGIYNAPTVIDAVVTSTNINVLDIATDIAEKVTPLALSISNGLQ